MRNIYEKLTNPAVGHEANEILRRQRLKHWHKELHEMIILVELATHTHVHINGK